MPVTLLRAEAARAAGWDDDAPPQDGWTAVTLPDSWSARWPSFDGVAWYRLRWDEPERPRATGLLLSYLSMAGAVFLNGVPIDRDASLVEPLTRAWNTPRSWYLAPPLLRPGTNTLLIRVSGFAAYQPGLGTLTLGAPAAVQALYRHERLMRHDLKILGMAVTTAVACLFATLWVLRRRESAYGWFAKMCVLWLLFSLNEVVTSPWPFRSTHGWQAFSTSMLLGFGSTFVVFVLRFCGLRAPRLTAALLALAAAGMADLALAAPPALGAHRDVWVMAAGLLILAGCAFLLAYSLPRRNRRQRALAPFAVVVAVAAMHDLLVFFDIFDSNIYYSTLASYALLFGMATVLALRFVTNLQRIEHFNEELIAQVSAARAELGATLAQQHHLELAHARVRERVELVSDLHDGLGGMLVGSIATLEHSPDALAAPQLLAMLKSLRDDLRLIIDATGGAGDARTFGELLVPLRHRIGQSLDASGIACHWRLSGLERLELPASQRLDVLRFLQEALTNVLKHSGARRVDVAIAHAGGWLDIEVRDDGHGFVAEAAPPGGGKGLPSLHARAARLGGALQLAATPEGTRVALRFAVRRPAPAGALPA